MKESRLQGLVKFMLSLMSRERVDSVELVGNLEEGLIIESDRLEGILIVEDETIREVGIGVLEMDLEVVEEMLERVRIESKVLILIIFISVKILSC